MKSQQWKSRRPWVAASITPFLVAGSATAGAQVADGALPGLSLKVVVATNPAVIEKYSNDGLYGDLGAYLSVGMSSPLEIRAKRASYKDPVKAEVVATSGSRRQVTPWHGDGPSTWMGDANRGIRGTAEPRGWHL
ncbi:MAG: hypothetical protein ACRCTR_08545 [Actinomycetota bacterium]